MSAQGNVNRFIIRYTGPHKQPIGEYNIDLNVSRSGFPVPCKGETVHLMGGWFHIRDVVWHISQPGEIVVQVVLHPMLEAEIRAVQG